MALIRSSSFVNTSSLTRVVVPAAIVLLTLTIASCRSGSSDQNEQPQGEAGMPEASAVLSVEWMDTDLEKNTSRVGYGKQPKAILARRADGALVLTPETKQDHIATAFVELPAFSGDRSIELQLDVRSAGGDGCAANLQDQAFRVLATVPCTSTGQQHATATIPSGVSAVRVYFQSLSGEPLILPVRVGLVEHR